MKKSNGKDNELYTMNNKAMDDLCQTNLDFLREIIDIEFNYSNLWQEYLKAQMDRLSTVKEASDVMAIESGLASEYTNKFSEANRRLYDVISNTMEEQTKCFNLPVAPQNLLSFFQGFEDVLSANLKKSNTRQSSTA